MSNSYGTDMGQLQRDIDETTRARDEAQADVDLQRQHPEKLAAKLKAAADQNIKCDLAKRSVNLFMSGR